MPLRPAVKHAASKRYGLAVGSAERISKRVLISPALGIRTSGERFLAAQAMYTGASKPGIKRLYELTVGLPIAVIARACSKIPFKK